MGMRWYYNLTTSASPEEETKIIADFRASCQDAEYALDEDGNSATETGWHDDEEDFKRLSKSYPDVLFTVNIDGTLNDSEDLVRIYFKNGKMQKCAAEITYPPYDESKFV